MVHSSSVRVPGVSANVWGGGKSVRSGAYMGGERWGMSLWVAGAASSLSGFLSPHPFLSCLVVPFTTYNAA